MGHFHIYTNVYHRRSHSIHVIQSHDHHVEAKKWQANPQMFASLNTVVLITSPCTSTTILNEDSRVKVTTNVYSVKSMGINNDDSVFLSVHVMYPGLIIFVQQNFLLYSMSCDHLNHSHDTTA